jgi:putative membrane protein
MMQVSAQYAIYPVIDAVLNGSSAVLLLVGRSYIKRGRMAAHRAIMITALISSALFLTSYLYYHWHVGSVHFQGQGWSRPVYFSILISHTILAIAIVPLVIITLSRALRERFDQHRRIARWTFPLWLYVSVGHSCPTPLTLVVCTSVVELLHGHRETQDRCLRHRGGRSLARPEAV